MEYIHKLIGDGKVRRFPSDTTISIGRGDCTIKSDDPALSRYHAYLVFTKDNKAFFGDGHPSGKPSKNGCFVNGKALRKSAVISLEGGERIVLGSQLVFFYQKSKIKAQDNDETFGLDDISS